MPVPQPTLGDAGFQAPAESVILAGVTADIDLAFGGGLNPALNTPQGQLASSEAAAIGAVNDLFLLFAAQSDPAFASGRMQDAIGRYYFIERNPAQPSVVQAQCLGALGVSVNAYQQSFKDPAGNVWTCQQSGTFTATGVLTLPFACAAVGPIPLAAGSTVQIFNGTPGWDTVTIPTDAVQGNLVESRTAFEARRAQSVAINAQGWLPAVRGAVLAVPGVIDVFVTENTLPGPAMVGGVSLAANSLYVCVAGGAPAAVAQAIFSRRGPGLNQNGNTTQTVTDTQSGYVPPYPTYQVSYQTAVPLSILVSVVIANSTLVPANANVLIQNAIVAAFAGLDGGPRAKIGVAYLASRLYPTVAALGGWAQIVDILVGSAVALPTATFVGSISGSTLTVTTMGSGSGAITVGQVIDDVSGSIVEGTKVLAFGTGTGGAGTYTVSSTQTVASETIYAGTATAYRVPVTIAQIPVTSAADISVSLG